MSRFLTVLLAGAALITTGGLAAAQMGSTYDPEQLPAITGKVAQFLPTPRGEVDGILLDDGTEVHVPPHLSTQLVFAVHPGDSVTIHGLKARALPMVAAASVTNNASHVTVSGAGLHGWRDGARLEATGTVKAVLHNPRGDADGVLLDSGAVVRLPPHEAARLAADLAVGKTVLARGEGVAAVFGTAIGAREIGPDAAHLTKVAGPRPDWDHGGPQHGPMGHDLHDGWMHHGMPGQEGTEPPPPPAQ